MAASTTNLDPISLTYWPTCQNALSWSSEDLAVAAGEVVYMLTPRSNTSRSDEVAGHKQWHTFTLRVNRFDQSEWPLQPMATARHSSLGEELSESTVVSLAWSPPGLGLYRRPVLAILTSGLVLSIWETDGRLGEWKRTCVVNQHLRTTDDPEHVWESRRQRRIRAFCWLPPMVSLGFAQWGPHFLAVADDRAAISIFRMWKNKRGAYGQWSFELMAQHEMETTHYTDPPKVQTPSLRSTLTQTSPISKLEPSGWHARSSSDADTLTEELVLKASLGHCSPAKELSVTVERRTRYETGHDASEHDTSLSIEECRLPVASSPTDLPPASLFEPAMQSLRSDFDEKFNLDGRIRTRWYGTTFSSDRKKAAACISLHPSDMIEYGKPSNQQTLVVFSHTQEVDLTEKIAKSESVVIEEIVTFVASIPTIEVETELDRNIIKATIALISKDFQSFPLLTTWAASASDKFLTSNPAERLTLTQPAVEDDADLDRDAMDLDQDAPTATGQETAPTASSVYESCEICEAPISFSWPLTSATCAKGHQFSRCSLSFVAIQEPGISKHCARCGRQFLDPGKLELPDGPSLSQALFDKFDLCPYCQGHFRG